MAKDEKKKPVTDLLEAAKKTAPTDSMEAAEAVEVPKSEPLAQATVPMPAGPPDVKAVSTSKFRVVEATTISLGGVFVKLNRDDIVSAALYGPTGLKQIMDANVPLQEIKE